MKSFKQYLISEAAKANTHLTHLEELVLKQGKQGYNTARKFLIDLLDHLETNSDRVGTTVKWDGAPAMFVGINPENGKFFVGTKSIFNINPKFNYTEQDVDLNHGNAPGLADKLKKALKYLPELGIKNILQGDFMFDDSSLNVEDIDGVEHLTFKPNTIKYAVEVDSDLGKKMAQSKFGIIFHTEYEDLGGGAKFGAKVNNLNETDDVWYDDAFFKDDTGVVTLTKDETDQIKNILNLVEEIPVNYDSLPLDLINIYTNVEIKQGEYLKDAENSYNTFVNFIKNRKEKEISKRKTEIGQKKISDTYDSLLSDIQNEKANIVNLFKISKHLSEAKQIFINKYNNAVYKTKHFIDGEDGTLKVSSPEGYVAIDKEGNAVKLVDRLEFSRANFMAGKPGDEEFYVNNPPIFNTGEGTRLQMHPPGRKKLGSFNEMFNIINEFEDAESLPKTVIIYPGRFHPFHKGHAAVYNNIKEKFPTADVFITTSDKQEPNKSPFSFEEKKIMMQSAGVDPNDIKQSTTTYSVGGKIAPNQALEGYDLEKTKVIFAGGERDVGRFPDDYLENPDTPLHFYKDNENLKFANENGKLNGYLMKVPTVQYDVLGEPTGGATDIRNKYKNSDEKTRRNIIMDLYGSMDEEVKRIFDNKLV